MSGGDIAGLPASDSRRSPDPFFMVELRAACQRRGCPLCRMRSRFLQRLLDSLLWENVTDPDTRQKIITARGFCHRHAQMLLEVAQEAHDEVGVAVIYEHLVRELTAALEAMALSPLARRRTGFFNRGNTRRVSLFPNDGCFACVFERDSAARDLEGLLHHLMDATNRAEVRRLYEESGGLCLPHFEEAVSAARTDEVRAYLRRVQMNQLTALREELAEFIRKHDYNVVDKNWGNERDSWRRAVAVCTGCD